MFLDTAAGSRILFLGEGNFSFSAGVVRGLGTEGAAGGVTASCYETQAPDQMGEVKLGNVEYLRGRSCSVLQGIDAQRLQEDPRTRDGAFTQAVFMFPHVGGKMRIERNRQLVLGFLQSCRAVLAPGGEAVITLARGQGGTPLEAAPRAPADSWQIVDTAHTAGFVLTKVEPLDLATLPAYSRVGYRGLQKGFHAEGALVHWLQPAVMPPVPPLPREDPLLGPSSSLPASLFPPTHSLHLSFWLPPGEDEVTEAQLRETVTACLAGLGIEVTMELIDRYRSAEGRVSLTVSLTYRSLRWALGAARAQALHTETIGRTLSTAFRVRLRV